MNRAFVTLNIIYILLMLLLLPFRTTGQGKNTSGSLSPRDMQEFRQQSEQLVKFMEFSFNTLGNPKVSAREKDVIINESYLKFFSSGKVQIEDDLVEGRFTVTNKDVQAYLKDIDFFYREVVFTFSIENIDNNINESGQIYFVVTTTRHLKGIDSEGDTIYNNLTRYIEINLDQDRRDLKIASIYTSKLSEKDDMRNWWISLNSDWRSFFAKNIRISNEFPLSNIIDFGDTWIVLDRHKVSVMEDFVMESRNTDTIKTNTKQIYQEINRIWKTETVDISNQSTYTDIIPLSKLNDLRSVNLSGNKIEDLTPLRNLTKLENLQISETSVIRLDPLRHSINLKNLDASNTAINDLDILPPFPSLEKLNLSNTRIISLEAIAGLSSLRDLRISNTPILSLAPVKNNTNLTILDISGTMINHFQDLGSLTLLERLHADNTKIADLNPLVSLNNLQYLFIEGTIINDIQMLTNLSSLKRIYCDRTSIKREQANRFMQENANVLVIYESQVLTDWWVRLSQTWKDIFREIIDLSEIPTREELHQVANISHININGNADVYNLSPLQQLPGLKSLCVANTNILTIEPLKENIDLIELDMSFTGVSDISVLSGLRALETLKLSNTSVESILPLASAYQLKYLDLDHTLVQSLEPLGSVNNLEVVLCDGIKLDQAEVSKVYEANPKVTVIFQTEKLLEWWRNLPETWKNIFEQNILIENPPTSIQLHRLTDIEELDISKTRGIQNLSPLTLFHRLKVLKMNDIHISDIFALENLKNIRELYCASNPISDLKPIGNMTELTILDCSNTLVRNLKDLKNLRKLKILNISGTQVTALKPIGNLYSLRQLDCYNTRIISLRPLENLTELELLRCYNTNVLGFFVKRFKNAVPGCEVVFY